MAVCNRKSTCLFIVLSLLIGSRVVSAGTAADRARERLSASPRTGSRRGRRFRSRWKKSAPGWLKRHAPRGFRAFEAWSCPLARTPC